ncbi:cytochrome P450 [Colletotrichum caudatum]|nr:cytochrome P450 [Colletotrichum caudatum]
MLPGDRAPIVSADAIKTFLIITLACRFIYRAAIYPRFVSTLRHYPTAPVGIPFIGQGFAQFSHPRGAAFLELMKTIPNSGVIRYFSFFNTEYLLLTNSEALSEVLVRRPYDFEKSPAARNLIRRFTGSKLLTAEGEEHKHVRKSMRPAFHFRKIKDLYPVFWAKATAMTDDIQGCAQPGGNGTVTGNVTTWVEKAMLNTIGRSVFGVDVDDEESRNKLLRLFATGGSTGWDLQLVFMVSAFLPRWTLKLIPGGINKRIDEAHAGAQMACEALLNERKKSPHTEDQKDILGQFIESKAFTEEELRDQIPSLLAAGYEPTSAAFAWVVWYLIQHPNWQTQLRDEIKANIPYRFLTQSSTEFDPQVLESLPILNAVCNESFRFMPTSPVISRQARCETTILGHRVPKGTRLLLTPYAINHFEESYGPTAGTFDPGRWLNDNGTANNSGGAQSNYAFLTFLHGPRKCIGDLYARATVRAFVASLVGRFEFEMAREGDVPAPGGMLTVKPKGGIEIKLRPVDPW